MQNFLNRILLGAGIVFDLGKWVILSVVILVLINKFWVTIFVVDGMSMETYLHDKEIVLLSKNSYTSHDPKRGDIVVVNYPGDPAHKKYVKRVIGLSGEKISIRSSQVYINDIVLPEYYLSDNTLTEPDGEWKLSAKEFFLMGDNRPNSNDSRVFGSVEKRFFVGKATMIIYPRQKSLTIEQY